MLRGHKRSTFREGNVSILNHTAVYSSTRRRKEMGANAHSGRSPSQYGHELLIVMYLLLYLPFRLTPSTGHHTPYCYGARQCSTNESFSTYRKDRRLRYGWSRSKFTSDCNVAVMPHSNIIDHKKVANLSAYGTREKVVQ